MIGHGKYDWWEEEDLEQDENRGQDNTPKPKEKSNEDGNANP